MMRNPLIKRLPRELKNELGKYIVIFVFFVGMIAIVSGFLVAGNSMAEAYDESFEKYNIEDGNFELAAEADSSLINTLQKEELTIYQNYYIEEDTGEVDSTLRIFKKREKVNLECLMEGEMPENADEIAIDRMYADNNELKVGDTLTVGGKELKISGLVALSDYSALFSSTSDMMFDAVKFGVAIVTEEGFEKIGDVHLHYSYSWKYENAPADDEEAKEMSDDFLEVLAQNAVITNYIPQYSNQAIHFTGNDIGNDRTMIATLLYIVVIIIAFVFAITTSNTIAKEANVIGTLRASGYSKGEILRHYIAMPMIVTLVAALVGNILGYTCMKDFAASMYYGSYSLPTYVTLWNMQAFIQTTVVPVIITFVINLAILSRKLSLSPLKFIRRDLSIRKKKKAFRLNTKMDIMKRFRIRIIFQNMPNYITIFIGVFLGNVILLFGSVFPPLLENFKDEITENMICDYQYVLKAPRETGSKDAEKYCAGSLKMTDKEDGESVMIYGVEENSEYVDIDAGSGVYLSNAYASKYEIEEGDKITLKEEYGDKEYSFEVKGVYYYPSAIAVFMDKSAFNETFGYEEEYFNGYFSNAEITDIDERYIATTITVDDMTKTSRQLEVSMGGMMWIFQMFGILIFMLIIYLLSKIIIEKNAQSISMTKILGYNNGEIGGLYIAATAIVVVLSLIITIPVANVIIEGAMTAIFASYSGWLPYYVSFDVFVMMAVAGIGAYAIIAFLQIRKVKRIPMDMALKNVE